MIDLSVYIFLFIIIVVLFHVFYKSNRLKELFFAKLYKRDESSHGFIFKDANFGIFSVDFFFRRWQSLNNICFDLSTRLESMYSLY